MLHRDRTIKVSSNPERLHSRHLTASFPCSTIKLLKWLRLLKKLIMSRLPKKSFTNKKAFVSESSFPTKKSAFADLGGPTQVGRNLDSQLKDSLARKKLLVKSPDKSSVEVAGFAPAEPWLRIQAPYSSTPTPNPLSQNGFTNTRPKSNYFFLFFCCPSPSASFFFFLLSSRVFRPKISSLVLIPAAILSSGQEGLRVPARPLLFSN